MTKLDPEGPRGATVDSGGESLVVGGAGRGRPEMGVDAEIAENWGLWSAHIGRMLVPTLHGLNNDLKGFRSAMICTADGFNLCTVGVDETGVLRLSALISSMHSTADAVTQAVHEQGDRQIDLLTLTDHDSTVVVLAIRGFALGKLLLWVAAEDETLGVILVHAQRASARVRQHFEANET